MRRSMPKLKQATISLMLATAGLGIAAARANVIFNSFGPGQSYSTTGLSVGVTGYDAVPSMAFTSSGTYDLTQLDLGLLYFQGTDAATVSLWTDVSGVPTTELQSWGVSGLPLFNPLFVTSISGISGVTISAGESYFIQVAPGDSTTFMGWEYNDQQNVLGTVYDTNNGVVVYQGNNLVLSAFDVIGTPVASSAVSEPGSMLLFAGGLLGLGLLWRRRKRAGLHG